LSQTVGALASAPQRMVLQDVAPLARRLARIHIAGTGIAQESTSAFAKAKTD
jgi:hypothetical protein